MYAVVNKDTCSILITCSSKEAALIASQIEKEKVSVSERASITAVTMDDGGFSDILF